MNVWYTPERMALYQEIDQRRMARHERREREARRRHAFEALGVAAESILLTVLGTAFLYALLLLATI